MGLEPKLFSRGKLTGFRVKWALLSESVADANSNRNSAAVRDGLSLRTD